MRIGPLGFEPRFPDPKSGVLPLDEGPAKRLANLTRLAGLLCALVPATALHAQAPVKFSACYVPQIGAMYLVNLPGLPAACLSPNHNPIVWTDGLDDGAVTAAKMANNSVGSAQVINGSIAQADLAAGIVAGAAGYQVVRVSYNQAAGTAASPVVSCPSGKRPIGGGALKASIAVLHGDHPVVPPDFTFNGWVFYLGPTTTGAAATSELYVICVTAP